MRHGLALWDSSATCTQCTPPLNALLDQVSASEYSQPLQIVHNPAVRNAHSGDNLLLMLLKYLVDSHGFLFEMSPITKENYTKICIGDK